MESSANNTSSVPLPLSVPLVDPSILVNPSWATESCIHCGSCDYHDGEDIAPRTIIICSSCCMECTHVECHQKAVGSDDNSFARENGDWFCSRGCQHVYDSMNKAIGAKCVRADKFEF